MVMGNPIKIIETKDLTDDDGSCLHGLCKPDELTIYINSTYPQGQRWRTLLHELAHLIIGLSGLSEFLDAPQEEAIVIALENGLYPLIVDVNN